MRFSPALAVVAALLSAVAPVRAADGPPVEINAMLSMTGAGAFFATSAAKTLTIIQGLVNASGGIAGRPLIFTVIDDASNPQTAVELATQLVAKRVPALLGPSLTATCSAIAPFTAKSGPVSYCISPSISPDPGSYMFSNGPTGEDGAAVLLRFIRAQGMTHVAILNSTDASGQAVDKALEAALALPENKPLTVVAHEHFAPNDVSVAAQISRIKAANPQALISWAVGTPFGTVLRGVSDGGLEVPVLTGAGNQTADQMKQYAHILPKQIYFESLLDMSAGGDVPANVAKTQAIYFKAFKAAGIQTDGGYGGIWDMAMMYVDAYKHYNGNPTADQVHDFIEAQRSWVGVNGSYDYSKFPQRGVGQDADMISTWNAATQSFIAASKPAGRK
ncbi:MAG TPA: ABC transporter substrate-binding protein [Candidatus Lustribacter sp.]|nr:ABC transporter substrate-binding protein [Candidatus Lustribacter sp.]